MAQILSTTCDSCHRGAAPAGSLSLEPTRSYAALVNVPAVAACTTQLRVKPGDPDGSVLIQRMIGTSCGQRMPVPETTYFDRVPEELAIIRTWIQNGAPEN